MENNKKPVGLRLDNEIVEILDKASDLSGLSKTEIIQECIRRYAGKYVIENLDEKKKMIEKYLNEEIISNNVLKGKDTKP